MRSTRLATGTIACGLLFALLMPAVAGAEYGGGSIIGWGTQVVGVDLSAGFVAVAAGESHSLGLKADGSIVAWGRNDGGQCNVPAPNAGFVTIAGGGWHSLSVKADGSIAAWGSNSFGQCDVPEPNTNFVAVACGQWHSLGLNTDGSIVAWGDNGHGRSYFGSQTGNASQPHR